MRCSPRTFVCKHVQLKSVESKFYMEIYVTTVWFIQKTKVWIVAQVMFSNLVYVRKRPVPAFRPLRTHNKKLTLENIAFPCDN